MQVPLPMSDKRFDQIYEMIQKSYPNACILYIDEVFNSNLLSYYDDQRKNMNDFKCEKQLFHGTSESAIQSIVDNGFDPTMNKSAAYGYGTYFAVNAKYSSNYMRSNNPVTHMFLADVLIGKLVTGQRRTQDNIYTWDNNVDNLSNPTIYTTPYHGGAYPRYIIAFHKNAR
jgi:hypothetical protein